MKNFLTFSLIMAFAFCMSSCATIFTKTKYPESISTEPAGATVTIENRANRMVFTGITPATVKLKAAAGYFKKEEYKVTITKMGYAPKVITITTNLDGWYVGNILMGGFIGMLIVDPASGAMYKIAKKDRMIYETLVPNKELSLQILDIDNLPEGYTVQDLERIN